MNMKKLWAAGFAMVLLGMASAQIPVTDVASIQKAIEQLIAWKKQYEQMAQQIQYSKQIIESATGTRGLANVLDAMGTNAVVDTNLLRQWQTLDSKDKLLKGALQATQIALAATEKRNEQVRALMGEASRTTDAKAIAEINARINAENAMIKVDSDRIRLMELERAAQEKRIEEEAFKAAAAERQKPAMTWKPVAR